MSNTDVPPVNKENNQISLTQLREAISNSSSNVSVPNLNLESKVVNSKPKPNIQSKVKNVTSNKASAASSLFEIKNIYVSPFLPDTEVSDIANHIKSNSSLYKVVGDLKCTKLVRNNQNINKLSFVSFKIEVPKRYYGVIMDPSVWPHDVRVKDFVDKSPPLPKKFNPFSVRKHTQIAEPTTGKSKNSQPASLKGQKFHRHRHQTSRIQESSQEVPTIANLLPLLTQCLLTSCMPNQQQQSQPNRQPNLFRRC